jgi:hypothetical protein
MHRYDDRLFPEGGALRWNLVAPKYDEVRANHYVCQFTPAVARFSVRCAPDGLSGSGLSFYADQTWAIRSARHGPADQSSPAMRLSPDLQRELAVK